MSCCRSKIRIPKVAPKSAALIKPLTREKPKMGCCRGTRVQPRPAVSTALVCLNCKKDLAGETKEAIKKLASQIQRTGTVVAQVPCSSCGYVTRISTTVRK